MQVKVIETPRGVAVVRANKPRSGGLTLGEFKTREMAAEYCEKKNHTIVDRKVVK